MAGALNEQEFFHEAEGIMIWGWLLRAGKALLLLLPLWLWRMAASWETVNGSSVRQELEEGLKASGGQHGKVGEGAVGSWIRGEEVQKVAG